ncbi:MAG: glutamine--fructose-6-phosphate transaminase (isomerizing) [Candidatus Omnitrophica bacterium]|nr:glutamine--fructose-6-phosphate transaminase (isomerizing) [Candidatus Omnitrophota bacterium]
MCGIFGYTGKKEAQGLVLEGLKHLEYRGYDSSGIAVQNGFDHLAVRKTDGKIKRLEEILKAHPLKGTTAIGHTRWATHGTPSPQNAHPHLDHESQIAVVHNGIIENYFDLKKTLEEEGVRFRSETDTEVIVHLVSKYYKGNLENAVRAALRNLKGTYAVAVIASHEPGKIVAAKCDSPLVLGLGTNESYLASDVSAVLEHTRRVIFLENGDVVSLSGGKFQLTDLAGKPVSRKTNVIDWDVARARKGGFEHFMLKEIFEQPEILSAILKERASGSRIHFEELKISETKLKRIKRITIIACGTAYHAGLTAKYIFEEFTDIPVWVDTSSEFRYRDAKVGPDTLVVAISQSGETADTLAGLREAKKKKALTLSVCNVLGSSLAREAHGVIYTHAGPEIAVASTKAYTAQLTVLYLLAFYFAQIAASGPSKKLAGLLKEFIRVPHLMQNILDRYKRDEGQWRENAHDFNVRYHAQLEKYFNADPEKRKRSPNGFFLYLGRNINYPSALEGALKLKEISYIPAEGYAAGEMKHGPIALIDENPWVICIAPQSRTYDKMISNIQEIRARGGCIIPIVTEKDEAIRRLDPIYVIEIPPVSEIFSPLLVIVPLQLIAYSVAREFGEDIDQPRNLAKSVTVE